MSTPQLVIGPRRCQEARNVPDGGGWRSLDRAPGSPTQVTTAADGARGEPGIGYRFVHTALDDHSRLAYAEILPDERKDTAAGFWGRATAWFASAGSAVERVLTDNGACYRSHAWRQALAAGITHKRTRPYRPQTNGKVCEDFARRSTGPV